jgi:hypothetical protein
MSRLTALPCISAMVTAGQAESVEGILDVSLPSTPNPVRNLYCILVYVTQCQTSQINNIDPQLLALSTGYSTSSVPSSVEIEDPLLEHSRNGSDIEANSNDPSPASTSTKATHLRPSANDPMFGFVEGAGKGSLTFSELHTVSYIYHINWVRVTLCSSDEACYE